MEKTKERLAPFHVMILIFMTQSGVMSFILPQLLADNFGTNGWASVIGFGLIATVNIGLIGLIYKLGRGRSIFEILEQAFPKFLLYPIYAAIASLWTMLGCLAGKEYVLIFQMFAFPTTNPMVFKLALDVLVFWLLTKGIYNISKAATIFSGCFFGWSFYCFSFMESFSGRD
nr:GerAB/ArcD/ProY family transporter [Paenibacillus gorillae]